MNYDLINPDEHYLTTYLGNRYYLLNPTEEQIYIEDIVNGLSIENRFNNCCPVAYTVLQHSIYVCEFAPEEFKLEGLLHDWTEAYLKDLPKPLKLLLPEYSKIEEAHEIVGARKFILRYPYPDIIKHIDRRLALTEAMNLLKQHHTFYLYQDVKPFDIEIIPADVYYLKQKFFKLYEKYRRD